MSREVGTAFAISDDVGMLFYIRKAASNWFGFFTGNVAGPTSNTD
jgi:hypothetical protein